MDVRYRKYGCTVQKVWMYSTESMDVQYRKYGCTVQKVWMYSTYVREVRKEMDGTSARTERMDVQYSTRGTEGTEKYVSRSKAVDMHIPVWTCV